MQANVKDTTTTRGREAETRAARFLEKQGLQLVDRNFRVRGGEIDLICRDRQQLVFVEVRLRSRSDYGGAAAIITAGKRQRLRLAAAHYLLRHPNTDARFDCVLIDGDHLEWLPNAFAADD